ncbi:MAG: DNA polymerase III subunit delta, partial [Candidatus Liberibacter asiaticus]|nr:DNA polymerase III subunit delta [Candidatus Liberibacter asiaticus]
MATIESHKFIQKSTKNLFLSHFVFIFYGSDKGLIFELINQFKKNISITYHDPFSLVVLNALEI